MLFSILLRVCLRVKRRRFVLWVCVRLRENRFLLNEERRMSEFDRIGCCDSLRLIRRRIVRSVRWVLLILKMSCGSYFVFVLRLVRLVRRWICCVVFVRNVLVVESRESGIWIVVSNVFFFIEIEVVVMMIVIVMWVIGVEVFDKSLECLRRRFCWLIFVMLSVFVLVVVVLLRFVFILVLSGLL